MSETYKRIVIATSFLFLGCLAGWFAQKQWTQRNIETARFRARASVEVPAEKTVDNDLGLITLKGSKKDVEKSQQILDSVGKTLQE